MYYLYHITTNYFGGEPFFKLCSVIWLISSCLGFPAKGGRVAASSRLSCIGMGMVFTRCTNPKAGEFPLFGFELGLFFRRLKA